MIRRALPAGLFAFGLAFMIYALFATLDFGASPDSGVTPIGEAILADSPEQTGAANTVTAVVLGYRGIDTLGEIAILFTAATAAGLVLGRSRSGSGKASPAGDLLKTGAELLFPLLLLVGIYIIVHGHLTPGGGFQGGVILAAALFLPVLARPGQAPSHVVLGWIEGIAGASFILIGLLALASGEAFLRPLLGTGEMGTPLSAGTLPLLYLALGLKVGAELAGLLTHLAASGEEAQ